MLPATSESRASDHVATATPADARRDELVERLFGDALGAMDLLCVYLGDQLGLYRAIADAGPSTSADLSSVSGVNERSPRPPHSRPHPRRHRLRCPQDEDPMGRTRRHIPESAQPNRRIRSGGRPPTAAD